MRRFQKHYPDLKKLCKCSPKSRKKFLSNCSDDFIKNLCDCVVNVLKGNIKVSKYHHKKLSKKKAILRRLARKSISLKTKRKIFTQHGGFLGSLLVPIISAVGGLLTDTFLRRN